MPTFNARAFMTDFPRFINLVPTVHQIEKTAESTNGKYLAICENKESGLVLLFGFTYSNKLKNRMCKHDEDLANWSVYTMEAKSFIDTLLDCVDDDD